METHYAEGMFGRLLERVGRERPIANGGTIGEVLVELNDEVIAEIVGHTAAVARRISFDASLLGENAQVRPSVVGIHHDIGRLRLGEGEAE